MQTVGEPQVARPRRFLRRIGVIAAEAVLILLAAALIASILIPAYKGVSSDPDRYEFFGAPARRQR